MKSIWQTAGATCNAKAACEEFGITVEDLKEVNVPCQWRSFHGNSYAVVIRADVERVARQKLGSQYEVAETRKALRSVNSELASVEAQRARLAERKAGLDAKLTSLGEPIEEPPKPAARGKGGRKAAASGKAAAAPAAKKARKRGGQARMMSGGPEGDPPAGPEPSLQGLKPGCSGIA